MTTLVFRHLFASVGRGSVFYPFTMLIGAGHVSVGSRVIIRRGCRLEVVDHGQDWTPEVHIGDDVNIEQNVHIVCHDRIRIGDRVSITANCAVVDVSHDHALRLLRKPDIVNQRSFVDIGSDSFLGYGCVVLPNVRIGRGCFVGAGSVVTSDLPDFAVAAGVPARVLRFAVPPQADGVQDHE